MGTTSVNNGTTFSQSPQVYKFITECPEYLSSNEKDQCDNSELDSHNGGGSGGGCSDLYMITPTRMNISEDSSSISSSSSGSSPTTTTTTTTASSYCFHSSPLSGSKRRLIVSNADNTTNNNSNTPLVLSQQRQQQQHISCSNDERHSSCEKLTRGKQKIPIEFISERTKRYSTFSKRKTGLMKKAVELAELTGAEVLLLVASETNHVYTFATQRLKGIIELECGKKLIQTCLSSTNSSMKTHNHQDLDTNNAMNNSPTRNQNINECEDICKQNKDDNINTNAHKDLITEPKHIIMGDKNAEVIPNSSSDNDNNNTPLLQIPNHNHNDISANSSQSACCNVESLEHEVISNNNNDNTPQVTYASNPPNTNQMLYLPVSIFPDASKNRVTLTPLSSNIVLMTGNQMTTAHSAINNPTITTSNSNNIPHQLVLFPQFNTLPSYSIPSNPLMLNSNLSTLNQLNMNLVNFLNVNSDIHNSNNNTNTSTNNNSPLEASTNSTPPSPSHPPPPLITATTQSEDVISDVSNSNPSRLFKKEFL